MEAQDVLSDEGGNDLSVRGPELPVEPGRRERGPVVRERVEPDVHHVLRVPRDRDAPGEARARDAEIAGAPTWTKLTTSFRRDSGSMNSWVARVENRGAASRTSTGGRSTCPSFSHSDRLAGVERTLVARLGELLLRLEAFAADAVPPLVGAEVDVAARFDLLPQLRDEARVALFVRVDEVVRLDLELGASPPCAGNGRSSTRRTPSGVTTPARPRGASRSSRRARPYP